MWKRRTAASTRTCKQIPVDAGACAKVGIFKNLEAAAAEQMRIRRLSLSTTHISHDPYLNLHVWKTIMAAL